MLNATILQIGSIIATLIMIAFTFISIITHKKIYMNLSFGIFMFYQLLSILIENGVILSYDQYSGLTSYFLIIIFYVLVIVWAIMTYIFWKKNYRK